MMKTIACNAPYGRGGLGRHLAHVVELARSQDALQRYYAYALRPGDEELGTVVSNRGYRRLGRFTPLRYHQGWRNDVVAALFDRSVARRLSSPLETFLGFGGRALRSFARARRLGARRLDLVAANSHVDNVARRHAEAFRRYGLEPSWLNEGQRKRTLAEYVEADVIYVASAYTHASFIAAGFPEVRLVRLQYPTDPRFHPDPAAFPNDGIFRVVYVGSVTVAKGVPVLVEAFRRLPVRHAELTLVGGIASRGMRRYMDRHMAEDPRIRLRPGDPLPHLQRADVCVHPSFEDGYAYAPMEALACGVPVIVTEDTGMKEHVQAGIHGFVVPTGNVDALVERLEHLHRHPLQVPFPA